MRKRNRKPRVEVPFDPDEDAIVELLATELDMSKSEVLLLGLTEEGRYQLEQAQARIDTLHPYEESKALADSNVRARGRRSLKHLVNKETPESRELEAKEQRAKNLLRQHRTLYEADKATGLGQKRIMELSRERHAEDREATSKALRERDKDLEQAPGNYGPADPLAERIRELREEGEYGPTGFPTLGTPWDD
jgi:hypothetical protein